MKFKLIFLISVFFLKQIIIIELAGVFTCWFLILVNALLLDSLRTSRKGILLLLLSLLYQMEEKA